MNPKEQTEPTTVIQELNVSEGIEASVEFDWIENTEQGFGLQR